MSHVTRYSSQLAIRTAIRLRQYDRTIGHARRCDRREYTHLQPRVMQGRDHQHRYDCQYWRSLPLEIRIAAKAIARLQES